MTSRIFSFLTLFFFVGSLCGHGGLASAGIVFQARADSGFLMDARSVIVPAELGEVVDRNVGSSGEMLIILQDAHGIPDGQKSIQKLIRHFQGLGVKLVGLEGAPDALDPRLLRSFPDKRILKSVLESYLESGELTGVSAAAVLNPQEGDYQGLELWSLYKKGIALYRKAMEKSEMIRPELKALRQEMNRQKQVAYPDVLRDWDELWMSIEAGNPAPEKIRDLFPDSDSPETPEKLFEKIEEKFSADPAVFSIRKKDRELCLVERLSKLELSRGDYEALISHGVLQERLKPVLQKMTEHFDFYRNALSRETVLGNRMLELLKQKKQPSALLVAGGFHTEGLKRLLSNRGAGWLVISPAVREIPQVSRYRERMKGDFSWNRYFRAQQGVVSPYDAFSQAVRDKLLRRSGSKLEALKLWRDQIVRDLSDQGRIDFAGDYLHFVDAAAQNEKRKILRADREETASNPHLGLDRSGSSRRLQKNQSDEKTLADPSSAILCPRGVFPENIFGANQTWREGERVSRSEVRAGGVEGPVELWQVWNSTLSTLPPSRSGSDVPKQTAASPALSGDSSIPPILSHAGGSEIFLSKDLFVPSVLKVFLETTKALRNIKFEEQISKGGNGVNEFVIPGDGRISLIDKTRPGDGIPRYRFLWTDASLNQKQISYVCSGNSSANLGDLFFRVVFIVKAALQMQKDLEGLNAKLYLGRSDVSLSDLVNFLGKSIPASEIAFDLASDEGMKTAEKKIETFLVALLDSWLQSKGLDVRFSSSELDAETMVGVMQGVIRAHSLLGEGAFADVYQVEGGGALLVPRDFKSWRADEKESAFLQAPIFRMLTAAEKGRRDLPVFRGQIVARVGGIEMPFILMDSFPQGKSLAMALNDKMPLWKAVKILGKVAKTLQFLASKGIIHRDISPNNVFILAALLEAADWSEELLEKYPPIVHDFGVSSLRELAANTDSADRQAVAGKELAREYSATAIRWVGTRGFAPIWRSEETSTVFTAKWLNDPKRDIFSFVALVLYAVFGIGLEFSERGELDWKRVSATFEGLEESDWKEFFKKWIVSDPDLIQEPVETAWGEILAFLEKAKVPDVIASPEPENSGNVPFFDLAAVRSEMRSEGDAKLTRRAFFQWSGAAFLAGNVLPSASANADERPGSLPVERLEKIREAVDPQAVEKFSFQPEELIRKVQPISREMASLLTTLSRYRLIAEKQDQFYKTLHELNDRHLFEAGLFLYPLRDSTSGSIQWQIYRTEKPGEGMHYVQLGAVTIQLLYARHSSENFRDARGGFHLKGSKTAVVFLDHLRKEAQLYSSFLRYKTGILGVVSQFLQRDFPEMNPETMVPKLVRSVTANEILHAFISLTKKDSPENEEFLSNIYQLWSGAVPFKTLANFFTIVRACAKRTPGVNVAYARQAARAIDVVYAQVVKNPGKVVGVEKKLKSFLDSSDGDFRDFENFLIVRMNDLLKVENSQMSDVIEKAVEPFKKQLPPRFSLPTERKNAARSEIRRSQGPGGVSRLGDFSDLDLAEIKGQEERFRTAVDWMIEMMNDFRQAYPEAFLRPAAVIFSSKHFHSEGGEIPWALQELSRRGFPVIPLVSGTHRRENAEENFVPIGSLARFRPRASFRGTLCANPRAVLVVSSREGKAELRDLDAITFSSVKSDEKGTSFGAFTQRMEAFVEIAVASLVGDVIGENTLLSATGRKILVDFLNRRLPAELLRQKNQELLNPWVEFRGSKILIHLDVLGKVSEELLRRKIQTSA